MDYFKCVPGLSTLVMIDNRAVFRCLSRMFRIGPWHQGLAIGVEAQSTSFRLSRRGIEVSLYGKQKPRGGTESLKNIGSTKSETSYSTGIREFCLIYGVFFTPLRASFGLFSVKY